MDSNGIPMDFNGLGWVEAPPSGILEQLEHSERSDVGGACMFIHRTDPPAYDGWGQLLVCSRNRYALPHGI